MSEAGDRSSIAALWSRGKQKLKGQAPSEPESPDNRISESDQTKHQARRAQVRSAQIRHRQRKANYQKELELELGHYRELILQDEAEATTLRKENETMKARLSEVGVYLRDASRESSVPMQLTTPQGEDVDISETTPEMFGDVDLDELTATLGMDAAMGTPAFGVSSASSGGSFYAGSSPSGSEPTIWLSKAQEDLAINFILSLEHICWDHFTLGDFPRQHRDDPEDPKPVCSDPDHGHTLMASTFVMHHAPSAFYDTRAALQEHQKFPASSPSPPALQWQSPAFNLEALRGLASSLSSGDKELTPVQAWFELAERYGPEQMVQERTLDMLRREFKGVAKCVAYGAALERGAFESVVGRVLRDIQ